MQIENHFFHILRNSKKKNQLHFSVARCCFFIFFKQNRQFINLCNGLFCTLNI